jgi:inhibitor of KinA
MKKPVLTYEPLGDSAVTVTIGPARDAISLLRARALATALVKTPPAGILDIVPAYASVTVYYDPSRVSGTGTLPYDRICAAIRRCAEKAKVLLRRAPKGLVTDRLVEIPVCYGGDFGPDLAEVAKKAKLSPEEVIKRHAKVEYRVQAIGFVPGFPYLSGLPERLHTPRRSTPREIVAAGSVGIGGAQTGVYPISTPGGWNLIGRSPSVLFNPRDEPAALLQVGDLVRFRPITLGEFAVWK